MASRSFTFRLPSEGYPKAVFETDYGFRGGRLFVDGKLMLGIATRASLVAGSVTRFRDQELELKLVGATDGDESSGDLVLTLGGRAAVTEESLSAPPSRSAWIHGWIALAASFFGFVASWLYLERARSFDDAWAMKMAIHTAGWHLLLTVSLFPASVWGQRLGIRGVQLISLIFFLIHLGMALANTDQASRSMDGPGIALFNALSGIFFAVSVWYGQTAHRDMDPGRGLSRALPLEGASDAT
ncbi:hypothetical protein L6R52_42980 [Myxococcota bacterium]|nr:hypothetical protein [Myxococcota bacterium]